MAAIGVDGRQAAPQTPARVAAPQPDARRSRSGDADARRVSGDAEPLLRRLPQHAKSLPAGAPLALDKANLADPGADADVWERVVKKLGVGAMPPQGSPTPGHAELTQFRSALVASLDSAAAKKNNPGRYVLHRLNRTEYANAVRDLLGVTVDVADLLPSDGGDFGFDNIATALTTSPLLLERYLTAGLRIAELAVGDAGAEPGTATYTISTVVTQNQHVDGLPLGTRGGTAGPPRLPGRRRVRVLGTAAEDRGRRAGRRRGTRDAASVHRHDRRQAGLLGADRRQGGPRVAATENNAVSREEFDKRMTSPRIKVTAGPHDVGFTFVERPDAGTEHVAARRCATARRRTTPPGMPRLRNGIIEGPYSVTGVSETRVAEAPVRLHAGDGRAGSAVRRPRSCPPWRAARSGGPSPKADIEAPLALLPRGAQARAATSTPASAPASRGF